MQWCHKVAQSCNSCGQSPTKKALSALLPPVLSVVENATSEATAAAAGHCDSAITGVQQLVNMALPTALLSPTKTRLFCSGSVAAAGPVSISPLRPIAAVAAPVAGGCSPMMARSSPTSAVKRRLAALQQGGSSSAANHGGTGNVLQALGPAAYTNNLHMSPASAAAAVAGQQSPSTTRTAKRLELTYAGGGTGSTGGGVVGVVAKPAQPVTPAVCQPQLQLLQPLTCSGGAATAAAQQQTGLGIMQQQSEQQQQSAAVPDAPGSAARLSRRVSVLPLQRTGSTSTLGLAAAAAAGGGSSNGSSGAGRGDDGRGSSDQLPSPRAVLEFPPELEAAAAAGNNSSNAVQAHTHQQHRHAAGPQQGHQQSPQRQQRQVHTMSGHRLALRYDIPVGFDWLQGLPAHTPRLGEGKLEVFVGPMFAGKTTALINRVRAGTHRWCCCTPCHTLSHLVTPWFMCAGRAHAQLGCWQCPLCVPFAVAESLHEGLYSLQTTHTRHADPPMVGRLRIHHPPTLLLGPATAAALQVPHNPPSPTPLLPLQVKEVSEGEGKVHVAVKSSKDARYSAHWVVSHDGRCMRCYTADRLAQFRDMMGPNWHKLQVGRADGGALGWGRGGRLYLC